MTLDRQSFFDVMGSFPSGVAIVTTRSRDGAPRGLTTTAVCSVSADPPTILVCIDLDSRTLAAARERGRFVVNIIAEGRSDLCLLFASKRDDKFDRARWTETASGLPLLADDSIAWAECATVDEVAGGDHVVLVARVEAGGIPSPLAQPLVYHRRSWGSWAPAQESADRGTPTIPAIEVGGRDLSRRAADDETACPV